MQGLANESIVPDGELFFVAVCTWRIPWSEVDKSAFWPAWLALPDVRRGELLWQHRADCASIIDRLHPKSWFKVMCCEDDVELFRREYLPRRAAEAAASTSAERASYDGVLTMHLVSYGAVRCMQFWVTGRYPEGTQWPVACPQPYESACELAARFGHIEMLQLLYTKGGWSITPLTMKIAAARGNATMLRYLIDADPAMSRRNRWKLTFAAATSIESCDCLQLLVKRNLVLWHESVATAAVKAGSIACLRYAVERGCRWDPMACVLATITTGTTAAPNEARAIGMRNCIDFLRTRIA